MAFDTALLYLWMAFEEPPNFPLWWHGSRNDSLGRQFVTYCYLSLWSGEAFSWKGSRDHKFRKQQYCICFKAENCKNFNTRHFCSDTYKYITKHEYLQCQSMSPVQPLLFSQQDMSPTVLTLLDRKHYTIVITKVSLQKCLVRKSSERNCFLRQWLGKASVPQEAATNKQCKRPQLFPSSINQTPWQVSLISHDSYYIRNSNVLM